MRGELGLFDVRVLRGMFGPKRGGSDVKMEKINVRSFIIFTLH
jgi:hypothetical protein